MRVSEQITIDAEPSDVLSALLQKEDINIALYEIKSFSYSLRKIKDTPFGKHFDIAHCKIVLEKKAVTPGTPKPMIWG